jgi:site-specific recombinase XerD
MSQNLCRVSLADPKTFSALVEHYRSKELPEDNHERKTRKTKKNYEGNLKNHILPRWGDYQLRDVCSVDVEEWLDRVDLAPSTKAKVRNIMSTVFRHGIRWGWLGQQENPIAMVRVSSKRLHTPETLTAEEFVNLFRKLPKGKGRWVRSARPRAFGSVKHLASSGMTSTSRTGRRMCSGLWLMGQLGDARRRFRNSLCRWTS